jgi:hypothetical protein
MREAGRALALDPALDEAADLVTRLMLEPPSTMPPEVAAVVAHEDDQAIERNAKLGKFAYLSFVAFIPLLASSGNYAWAITLGVAIAVNAVRDRVALVRRTPSLAGGGRELRADLSRRADVLAVLHRGDRAIATIVIVRSPDYDQRSRALARPRRDRSGARPVWPRDTRPDRPDDGSDRGRISFAGPAMGTAGARVLALVMLSSRCSARRSGSPRGARRGASARISPQAWQLARGPRRGRQLAEHLLWWPANRRAGGRR